MNAVNNVVDYCGQGAQSALKVIGFAVENCEPLEKIAKITFRVSELAKLVLGGLSVTMSNFAKQLGDTILVFESLRFIGVMKLLLTKQRNGEYLLTDPKTSWAKCIDRVALAFHTAFKSVKGLNKFGFVELGWMAKDAIGKLPIFTLVMDSFILISCFFSGWDSATKSMPEAQKKLARAEEHLSKWEYRDTAINLLKSQDEYVRQDFVSKYTADIQKIEATILEKTGKTDDRSVVELKAAEVKLHKVSSRLALLANENVDENNCKVLAEDLEKNDINFKLKQWKLVKKNASNLETRVVFRIANSVSKIAVVILALTLVAMNVWTAPFLFTLIAMGIVSDSLGLTKTLLEEFLKDTPELKKVKTALADPVLVIA